MTFYIVVKAKKNGRTLDETILEFDGTPHQKKIETEIRIAQNEMQHYLNIKGLEFTFQYANTEQQAKNTRLWGIAGKGNYVVIK